MKRYRVKYGSCFSDSIIGKNLNKKEANKLANKYYVDDDYMHTWIEEYEIDIKEERKKKLEKIKKISDDKKRTN